MRYVNTGAILAIALQIIVTGCSVAAAKTPDMTGTWRLDPASSSGPRFGGPRREGRPEGRPESRPEGERGRWSRGPRFRLPDVVRIEQSEESLKFADSLGAPVGEIHTGKKKTPGDLLELSGKWHGDQLEVVQSNPRGGQMTQTYHLTDNGRTLEVKMHMERGDMPAREFVRVYRRQGA